MMAKKRDTALQSSAQLRICAHPSPVSCELIAVVEAVPLRESLQRKACERRSRLTDCKSRTIDALQDDYSVTVNSEDTSEKRSGKPASDNCNFTRVLH